MNQRIAQAAVRRANALTALVEGRPAPPPREGSAGRVVLTTQQVRIARRIADAALRRAVELDERVPDLPVPRPPAGAPGLERVTGSIINRRAMRLSSTPDGSLGEIVALVLPPGLRGLETAYGNPVVGEGILTSGHVLRLSRDDRHDADQAGLIHRPSGRVLTPAPPAPMSPGP